MTNFPELRAELQRQAGKLGKELAGPMGAFASLHRATLADGALPKRHKELIALGIGIAARCEGCIAYHVHGALGAGASRQEVLEAIGVAVMMGGGPASVYACEAYAALEQFEAKAGGTSPS